MQLTTDQANRSSDWKIQNHLAKNSNSKKGKLLKHNVSSQRQDLANYCLYDLGSSI